MKKSASATIAAALGLAASLAVAQAPKLPAGGVTANGDNRPAPTILLVPVEVQNKALDAGCWAQFYDKKDFKGDLVTLVGPAQLDALDKGTARQLHRDIDSLVTGPHTKLVVYEHRLFKDRAVEFGANAREGSLRKKLGFGGRIESIQVNCS
ncbi:hypothetical protein [Xylophilus sp.]|uniref:hypothetical protein n=1 Tax=Xylophilus sp. TaxID=2653893 RepID=UPI0013B77BEA|nr:hypothetical protein [Xylophilus sp.]KAF1046025.1 MAG: hypothetical protein GAK38_02728 [Xylophilus sp.]